MTAELVAEASLPEDQARTSCGTLSRNSWQFTGARTRRSPRSPWNPCRRGTYSPPVHMLDASAHPVVPTPPPGRGHPGALLAAPSARTSAATRWKGRVLLEQPAGAAPAGQSGCGDDQSKPRR